MGRRPGEDFLVFWWEGVSSEHRRKNGFLPIFRANTVSVRATIAEHNYHDRKNEAVTTAASAITAIFLVAIIY